MPSTHALFLYKLKGDFIVKIYSSCVCSDDIMFVMSAANSLAQMFLLKRHLLCCGTL